MSAVEATGPTANPFTETIDGDYFVGREQELAIFEANLQGLRSKRPIHGYVAGIHGTGKTFYLYKISDIARSRNFCAVTSVLDASIPAYDQMTGLLRAIVVAVQSDLLRAGVPSGSGLEADWRFGEGSKLFQHPRHKSLTSDAVRQDLETLAEHARAAGRDGIVVCIDEGQRIEPFALSALKNALQPLGFYMVMLSLRLASDSRGGTVEGRSLLEERASLAEGDIGAARLFVTGISMGPFASDLEVHRFFEKRTANSSIHFSHERRPADR